MPPSFMIELSDVVTKASENARERLRLTFEELGSSGVEITHNDMGIGVLLDKDVNVSYVTPIINAVDTLEEHAMHQQKKFVEVEIVLVLVFSKTYAETLLVVAYSPVKVHSGVVQGWQQYE
jgi:hypothetical protein